MSLESCASLLTFGGILASLLFAFLCYIILAFFLRAFHGEKVLSSAAFWFYVSSMGLTTVFLTLFYQLEDACQLICFSVHPIQFTNRIATVAFIFYKLNIFHPQHIIQAAPNRSSCIDKCLYTLIFLYTSLNMLKGISRIAFGSKCYNSDEAYGCVLERDPIINCDGVTNIPFITLEFLLMYKLIKDATEFYYDVEFIENNEWIQTEVVSQIIRFGIVAIIILSTNCAYFFAVVIIRSQDSFNTQFDGSPVCSWMLFVNLGLLNIGINVAMVTLCFPLRSINIYHLIRALCKKEHRRFSRHRRKSSETEISPKVLRQYYELELEKKRKREVMQNTLHNATPQVQDTFRFDTKRIPEIDSLTGEQVIDSFTPSQDIEDSENDTEQSSDIVITGFVIGDERFLTLRE